MRLRRMGLPPGLGLLLLSALWALGAVRTELFPRFGLVTVSHALGQAVLFFIFAVVAACIAVVRRVEFPRGRSAWRAPASVSAFSSFQPHCWLGLRES